MSTCTRCGQCCQEVPIAMPMNPDLALFFGLRGWDVGPLPGGRMEVVTRTPCKAYQPDAEDGKHCPIYERRPQFCRDYLCPQAKEATA
jgi:Fe-S-cluster containining protein